MQHSFIVEGMEVTQKENKKGMEEVQNLPGFLYGGEIIVIEEEKKVDAAVEYLSAHACLGFDTETRPAFRKGEYHPVSLLQLAAEEKVYLFRLNKCGFTPSLKKLLANEQVVKVGVGIRDDLRLLKKLEDFVPAAFIELQEYVENFGIIEKSFSKLMAVIFHVKISKRQRTSNWELPVLSEAQIRYAATDAWGALRMYQELKEHYVEGRALGKVK